MSQIVVGSRVRSFDFESRDLVGTRACYVEGVVEDIGTFPGFPDCPRYKILVDRVVFEGEVFTEGGCNGACVFPPVNGTPKMFGGATDGVEVIQ